MRRTPAPPAPPPRVNSRRERGTVRAAVVAETKPPPHKVEPQRIAKLLARAGVASRRDIERMITGGRIKRNGVVVDTPATILTSLDGVTVDDVAVRTPEPTRIFRLHKTPGCLTTAYDPKGRPTIYGLLPKGLPRLQPVGRLDMNTEGLLLLTTDGELKRALELPANKVSRRYRVRVFGTVEQHLLERLAEGVTLEGVRYDPIIADVERKLGRNSWLSMTLTEGKNREVRRVVEAMGLQVTRLIRVAYGPFQLDDLEPGKVIEADTRDVTRLMKTLKLAA